MATEQAQQKQSRNGKKPVTIPKGVTVAVDGGKLTVKGSKGEVVRTLRPEVVLEQKDGSVTVAPAQGSGKFGTQYQGLTRALLQNMVTGVSEGYKVSLDFRGVGYRAEFNNGILKMTVGLSHQPELPIPPVVSVKVEQIDMAGTKFPRVHLESVDKDLLGQVAAHIRSQRPPEPYKGKGVRYTGEKIREKAGKSGKK
jgi:large subunit ribosomal protein L6